MLIISKLIILISFISHGNYTQATLVNNSDEFILDDKTANTNDPKLVALQQVPKGKDALLFSKGAAYEPAFIYEGALRGKGYLENEVNIFILELKKKKIPVYVDYFTSSKNVFYKLTPGFKICAMQFRSLGKYKKIIQELTESKYQHEGKFMLNSFPYFVSGPTRTIGIAQKKRHLFSKHLWSNTNIYNIESLINDSNLYTTKITDRSTAIGRFIFDKNYNIKEIYKKRVYDFVASNAIQITLMLNANRMDYAETGFENDFYAKQLKIGEDKIQFAEISFIHPKDFSIDENFVYYIECRGDNLKELELYISTINSVMKKFRGNYKFYEKVLKKFSQDLKIPYVAPEDFYGTKYTIKFKKEFDKGFFDLPL